MQIRDWAFTDCKEIAQLEKKCFSDPWSLNAVEETAKLNSFFGLVLEEEKKVVGYIGCISVFEDGEILLVAVDQEFRSKGFGKALVNSACDIMKDKGVKSCFLEVRKSNQNAFFCYLSCGFKPIGERKRYYSNGEDAIVMEKVL